MTTEIPARNPMERLASRQRCEEAIRWNVGGVGNCSFEGLRWYDLAFSL